MKVKQKEPTHDAVQWTGDNRDEIQAFFGDKYEIAGDPSAGTDKRNLFVIDEEVAE